LYIHIYLVTTLIFILDNYILYKRQSVRNFLIHGEGYVLVYKFVLCYTKDKGCNVTQCRTTHLMYVYCISLGRYTITVYTYYSNTCKIESPIL